MHNASAQKRTGWLLRAIVALLCSVSLVLFLIPSAVWVAAADPSSDQQVSKGDDASDSDGENDDDGDDSGEEEKNHVTELFLKWGKDYGGANEFVGEGQPLKNVTITKKGQLVQLLGYYLDASESGKMLETASSSTDLGSFDLDWESSNLKVATVSPDGLVTPVGNGKCTITAKVAKPEKYGEASVSVPFVIDGQEGEYVKSVEITDKDGKVIKETVLLEGPNDEPMYYQLYAKIKWVDADGNTVRTEYTKDKDIKASYKWETAGNTETVNVNKETGNVSTKTSGIGQVVCTVSGGVGGKSVSDTVYFRVDTGQYGYNPADKLTLNVYYEDYPDKVVNSITLTVDELDQKFEKVTRNFTVIGDSGFATIRATGYEFRDILKELRVDFGDIKQFRFGTADSYDTPVGYSYLFGKERYYYPDYDLGFTSSPETARPILATANNIHWNQSYINPKESLDEGTRFRLVFGVTDPSDSNTSKQVYYINTIKVILKGSPPAQTDPDSGGSENKGEGSGNNGSGGGGTVGPSGSGGSGNSNSSSGGKGDSSGKTSGNTGKNRSEDANQSDSNPEDTWGKSWRIYQMMSDSKSDPGELDIENPLSPFAIPAAVLMLLLGGFYSFVSYRRRRFA